MRFSKPVKNLITMLYIINVLLICPVALFIPALALAQGKCDLLIMLNFIHHSTITSSDRL